MSAISFKLLIDGSPAGPELMEALQQIEVEEHTRMADMLRLRIAVGVKENGSGWTLLDGGPFERLTSLGVTVSVGNTSETLINAHVIETDVEFSNEPGRSVLKVVAMDPTVLMNLEEKVRPWPDMADSDVANAIFGEHGFSPEVEQTQPTWQEVNQTTIQRGTDIQFLRRLAGRNGYECYVETGSGGGSPAAHFHPPRLDQSAQGVLSVNMGQATNVNKFEARYDMLHPTAAQATGLDIETQSDQQAEVESSALLGLGSAPALGGDRSRKVLLSRTGLAQTADGNFLYVGHDKDNSIGVVDVRMMEMIHTNPVGGFPDGIALTK